MSTTKFGFNQFKISCKYVPPKTVGVRCNLLYNEETGAFSFTENLKEEGTVFKTKEAVDKVLLELFVNREKYRHMIKDSRYLELWVHQGRNSFGHYGDMMSIKFYD